MILVRLLQRIGAHRPYFDIQLNGHLYMRRWWLIGGSHPARDADEHRPTLRTWRRGVLDAWIGRRFAARLHHIVREDSSRDLHTHPCSFVSIVLSGSYVERLPLAQDQHPSLDATQYRDVLRQPGSVAFRRADARHSVVWVSYGGCWTIFAMGRKRASWGFWTNDGFVHWRAYQGGSRGNVMSPSEVGSATMVTSGPNAAILVKETTLSPAAMRATTLDLRVLNGFSGVDMSSGTTPLCGYCGRPQPPAEADDDE